jgi:hypothetical protein
MLPLLEEPYEALEALESGDHGALREELGDVLRSPLPRNFSAARRAGWHPGGGPRHPEACDPAAPLRLNAARRVPQITELHGRLTEAVRSAACEANGYDRSCVLQ